MDLLTLQIGLVQSRAGLGPMSLYLDTSLQYLKGVGPKLGQTLRRRGIATVQDLLEFYPRAYEDRRAVRSISSLEADQVVSMTAQILSVRSMPLGRTRRKIYEVVLGDNTGRIACKYFRVPYKGYFERFQPQQRVRVTGKVTEYRGRIEFHHPDIVEQSEEDTDLADQLLPIYVEVEGLSVKKLRHMVDQSIAGIIDEKRYEDPLPEWLRKKYDLLAWGKAIQQVHQPTIEQAEDVLSMNSPAHRRLIFDEFFKLELVLAARKNHTKEETAYQMQDKLTLVKQAIATLPFQLTEAQKRCLWEVIKDLQRSFPMHRLVQGDVGSGKTMVALLSAVFAMENGFQAAIMVPTEILAEQHARNASGLLAALGLKVGLLTGSMKAKERSELVEQIRRGEIHLVVGTHALIQDDVDFDRLGLVIIDEQHRFGVHQRAKLKQKGISPHFLVMTATPIPRTLAMTVYGDLDVSLINEMPKGRTPIVTRVIFDNKRPQLLGFVKEQLSKGRQAYFVYPLVEESEKIELKDAISEYERLKSELPQYRIGLLHGRMKSVEKEAVMREFRSGQFDVLVSTTVIEVGVDVSNANLMVIEHAERFGLSQLHQLRGRVGRGEHKSYCVLVLGYAVSEESKQRAKVMERTSDGFEIAEADLEIRGPGEFLGTRQSGLPGFKLANLVRDLPILKQARDAAFELMEKDPGLKRPEHQCLADVLKQEQEQWTG